MTKKICTNCASIAHEVTSIKGSFGSELFFWMLAIIPGLFYSMFRSMSKERVCPKCGQHNMAPVTSPVGRELINKYHLEDELEKVHADITDHSQPTVF